MSGTEPLRELPEIDYSNPAIDQERAGRELIKHVEMVGLSPVRVRWMPDAEEGYLQAERGPRNSQWESRLRWAERDLEPSSDASVGYLTRATLWAAAWRPFEDRARLAAQDGVWRKTLRQNLATAWTAAGGAVRALGCLAGLGSAKSRLEKVAYKPGPVPRLTVRIVGNGGNSASRLLKNPTLDGGSA